MDYSELENWETYELKQLMVDMELKPRRSRKDMIQDIRSERTKYYRKIKQLGDPGKDAITYHVKFNNKNYAMKQFKKRKSPKQIKEEVYFQTELSKLKISPSIIDVDYQEKYIIMEKLDKHLIDVTDKKEILLDHQKQLIKIYENMDDKQIFHGDPNPLNYMIKGKKLYAIDFGMSKNINKSLVKKLGTSFPNKNIMTLAMVLKLKNMAYPKTSYSYLSKFLTDEQCEQFQI